MSYKFIFICALAFSFHAQAQNSDPINSKLDTKRMPNLVADFFGNKANHKMNCDDLPLAQPRCPDGRSNCADSLKYCEYRSVQCGSPENGFLASSVRCSPDQNTGRCLDPSDCAGQLFPNLMNDLDQKYHPASDQNLDVPSGNTSLRGHK